MKEHIEDTLAELGLATNVRKGFPSQNDINLIEHLSSQPNLSVAVETAKDRVDQFEKCSLNGCISALKFVNHLKIVLKRASSVSGGFLSFPKSTASYLTTPPFHDPSTDILFASQSSPSHSLELKKPSCSIPFGNYLKQIENESIMRTPQKATNGRHVPYSSIKKNTGKKENMRKSKPKTIGVRLEFGYSIGGEDDAGIRTITEKLERFSITDKTEV